MMFGQACAHARVARARSVRATGNADGAIITFIALSKIPPLQYAAQRPRSPPIPTQGFYVR
jgi:hypothetical protein